MSSIGNLNPLLIGYAAHARIFNDMVELNLSKDLSLTLSDGPSHSHTTGGASIYARARNLWGPYGAGKVGIAPAGTSVPFTIFDSSDDSITELDPHGEGSGAFDDIVQVNEEWMCLIPANSDYIGWQNIRYGTYVRGVAHGVSGAAFSGATLAKRNGRLTIVCAPNAAAYCGYIDPVERTLTWSAAAKTGVIYGCRLMAETNRVFMKNAYLDVDTDTITTGSTAESYHPVLMLDRTIGQAPFSASRWFFHNFDLVQARQTVQWGTGDKLRGCTHAPNGHLIGAPEDEDVVPYYNPRTNAVTNGPALSGSNQIASIVLMPDGRHLLVPRTIGSFKIYEHVDGAEMPAHIDSVLASPYFN